MKLFIKTIILGVAVVVMGFLLFNFTDVLKAPVKQPEVCFNNPPAGGCFDVEVADTNAKREQGLMNRESLEQNQGMLFVFDKEDVYSFWMKNTLIALDMIWIDKDGKVVFIKEDAQPCEILECPLITPDTKAKYVLEINEGLTESLGIKIGDMVKLNKGRF